MLAIPSGRYQTCNLPYVLLRFVITAPVLQLILIPRASVFTPLRYFPLLKAVMVEHTLRYAHLSGRAPPCISATFNSWCPSSWPVSPLLLLLIRSCEADPAAPCSSPGTCTPNDLLLYSGSSGTPPCCWSLDPCLTIPSLCSLCCSHLLPSSCPTLLVPLPGLLYPLCPLVLLLSEGRPHPCCSS